MSGVERVPPSRRPLILWAGLIAIVPAVALEMVLLPNLRDRPEYLALVVLTTGLALTSIALSLSGQRAVVPSSARLALRLGLWGLVAADLAVFLVLPLVRPQPAATARPVDFASPAPGAAAAPAVPSPAAPASTAGALPAQTGAGPTPSQPRAALTGQFDARAGPDSVAGRATLGRTAQGGVVLSLNGLNATPGPDLYVYLATEASPSSDSQVRSGLEVGPLRATRGDLNYDLDPKLDYSRFRSVVIYCRSFSAVFGFANLS